MTYPHVNAVRDSFNSDDFRLSYFAICAASWVDHDTGILRASWKQLAKPIAKVGKPAPRATAVRYMAELQRLGVFNLIHRGASGGRDNNQWRFMLPCANYEDEVITTVPHAEGVMEQSTDETVPRSDESVEQFDMEQSAPTVPFSSPTVPRSPVGLVTREVNSMRRTHAHARAGVALPRAASRKYAGTSNPETQNRGNGSGILSDDAIKVLGIRLGMEAHRGESAADYRARVLSEDRRRHHDD